MHKTVTKGLYGISIAGMLVFSAQIMAGTLFIGADTEDFAGGLTGAGGIDRLGVATVNGATHISTSIIFTDFLLNGMADAGGQLLTGTPQNNTLTYAGFDGSNNGSITADIPGPGTCCNEELLYVPQAGGGDKVYHAHYGFDASAGIREIDPITGDMNAFYALTDVVGMALVDGDIWITRWGSREVGIWDPVGGFTVKFDLDAVNAATGSSFGNAGGLAYDPLNGVLWLGTQGGLVTPFDVTGNVLGASFQPFGNIPDTIDGLTFLGEVTHVPEPASLLLMSLGLIGLGFRRKRLQ